MHEPGKPHKKGGRRKRYGEPGYETRTSKKRQDPNDPQPRSASSKQDAADLTKPPTRPGPKGGRLRTGGTNKGGKGATPSLLRGRCREQLAEDRCFNIPRQILLSTKSTNKEKMEAWKALAQFGGLAALSITDGDGKPLELPPFIVAQMAHAPSDTGAPDAG